MDATSGYAPVNGLELYYESRGEDGTPLVVVLGGYHVISLYRHVLDALAASRRVVALELQAHGHTADIDRPFSYEAFGDDVAGAIEHLELGPADLLGWSLGGGTCLRAAIQHPDLVRKLCVLAAPFRRDSWYPEVRAAFDQMSRANFEFMQHSPMYQAYSAIGSEEGFLTLIDKTGELQRIPYDWSDEVRELGPETLLVFADADSIPASEIAAFYTLLGGGQRDAGWDGAGRPSAQLAILPGQTHYDIFESPLFLAVANAFFA